MIGDIVFMRGDSFFSKIINKLDGEYSHVALSMNDMDYGDMVLLEAQRFTDSRIVKVDLENYTVIRLNLNESQKVNLLKIALNSIDYEYDYRQILSSLFNKLFKLPIHNDKSKLICSELILTVLFEIGYLEIQDYLENLNCTPNELFELLISLGGEVIEC